MNKENADIIKRIVLKYVELGGALRKDAPAHKWYNLK